VFFGIKHPKDQRFDDIAVIAVIRALCTAFKGFANTQTNRFVFVAPCLEGFELGLERAEGDGLSGANAF
jgi:hypothetical protein